MTADKDKSQKYRITGNGAWANAWKVTATLAAIGIVGALAGYFADSHRFFHAWLFAFTTFLTIGLGAIFFTVVLHFTGGGWGVTVRRTAELFLPGVPVLALLALPVLLGHGELYEWSHTGHGGGHAEALLGASTALAQEHAAPAVGAAASGAGEAHGTLTAMEQALHHELLEHKAGWLNVPFWLVRSLAYLVCWILLASAYFRWSTTQDRTRDPKLTAKMQWWSPLSTVLLGLTLTFAAFDWLMALEPAWYSTMFGVYVFAASVVATFATIIVVALSLHAHGHFGDAVHVEHFHDLGKLLFGFICFWAYIGFSQWMLIWYAGIPEEATYYHQRWDQGGWTTVSLLLMAGHFVAPFFFLISRIPKRSLPMLGFGASWMLFIHMVDVYWLVMPYASDHFAPHWIDVACLLAVGGIFLTVVFSTMRRHPLIPIGDPRLPRSVHFVQTQ